MRIKFKSLFKKIFLVLINSDGKKRKLILQQLKEFEKSNDQRFRLNKDDLLLCLHDNTENTYFDSHYVYHPAWAARIIKEITPVKHIDIGSTLHFCSIISTFIKTDFYDYRPANLNLANLTSAHADLTCLPFESGSIKSLSCMHTIEHIGLGRYGDPINPTADLTAIEELKRVCAINGSLLIVVPVGIRRIQFNAHRIYDPFDITDCMQGFKLNKFSLIDDNGKYIENANLGDAKNQNYACGCYWFIKS